MVENNNKQKENNVTKEESSMIEINDNTVQIKKICEKNFPNKSSLHLNSDRNNRDFNQTDIPSLKINDKIKFNIKNNKNKNDIINNIVRAPSLSNLSAFSKDNKCYIFCERFCSISFKKCYNSILFILGLILFTLYIFKSFQIQKTGKIKNINKIYFLITQFFFGILIIIYYFINNYILSSFLMKNYIILILHIIMFLNLFIELYIFFIKKETKYDKFINLFFCFLLWIIPLINLIILKIENKKKKFALHNIDEILNFTDYNKNKQKIESNEIYEEKLKNKLGKKDKEKIELIEEENNTGDKKINEDNSSINSNLKYQKNKKNKNVNKFK